MEEEMTITMIESAIERGIDIILTSGIDMNETEIGMRMIGIETKGEIQIASGKEIEKLDGNLPDIEVLIRIDSNTKLEANLN